MLDQQMCPPTAAAGSGLLDVDAPLVPHKIQPWKGVKPKNPSKGTDVVRHEFKVGEMILATGSMACSHKYGS